MHGISSMKNSSAQEKSRGVVIFAYNTSTVNYEQIALQASRLVTHTLKLPVTVFSKQQSKQDNYRIGYAHGSEWFNHDRYCAYTLSPYDETILLDSDYLILDDALLKILDTVDDYRIMTNNQYPVTTSSTKMGPTSLSHVWATAVMFKKTAKAKQLFDLVGRIQRNYDYYRKLYNFTVRNFRNDYAFAVADNIINGYIATQGLPWSMLTIDKPIKKIEIKNDNLIVREEESAHVITKQSLHVMDKDYLQSDEYIALVDQLCQN